ncbi:selenocysteine insertion sequence-binding protein 2-like [Notamacropus eugenii]|uniref:selenocysteine insertion sequence-binding protein 2-like n=1 Tax=Notamacropus eugenii TaxID=9315 RepID=UPI003B683DF4
MNHQWRLKSQVSKEERVAIQKLMEKSERRDWSQSPKQQRMQTHISDGAQALGRLFRRELEKKKRPILKWTVNINDYAKIFLSISYGFRSEEFELKLLDFPKLQGSENSDKSEIQKQPKWGPLSSTASDISLMRKGVKPTLSKEELVVKAERVGKHIRRTLDEIQQNVEVCPIVTQPVSPLLNIYSRRFRDYCSQMLSKEVDDCVMDLVKQLVSFQDSMYQKDPVKAKIKPRLVIRFREVLKHLILKKLICVIISPNCEKSKSKGGSDETMCTITDYACEQNVPFVFAPNRKALGQSINKVVSANVVGIFSYYDEQDQFHKLIELRVETRQSYKVMLSTLKEGAEAPEIENPLPPLLTPQGQSCSSELSKTTDTTEKETQFVKICKKNLEEYNPYALELEQTSNTEMLNLKL